MKVKIISITVCVISLIFLSSIVQDSHSQPPGGRPGQGPPRGEIIQPDEIAKTLDDVKQKPTTNETFEKRIKVIEAWIMLSAMSGKGEEIRQTAPPGIIQNIKRLKTDEKEGEAFKSLDDLFLKMEKVGLPQKPDGGGRPVGRERKDPAMQGGEMRPRLGDEKFTLKEPSLKMVKASLDVDFERVEGEISPYLFGTILGPDCSEREFELLKQGGFRLLQTTLPLYREGEDYNFEKTDRAIAAMLNIGADAMVIFQVADTKPKDLADFSKRVKEAAQHIAQNWDKKYPGRVRILRFGNEPDFNVYWKGTKQDFFDTYAAWAKAVKDVNKDFIVEGPGIMSGCEHDGPILDCARPSAWLVDFLSFLEREKIPLDYLSFHGYSPLLYSSFYLQAKTVMNELRKYPNLSPLYGTPKLANDEWNIMVGKIWSGAYNPIFGKTWTAAQNIGALINMTNQGLGLSIRYGGVCKKKDGAKGDEDFLMVNEDSTPKPVYYAFKGFSKLADTPLRLNIIGNDNLHITSIAGKSKDNNLITIVVVNYDSYGVIKNMSQDNLRGVSIMEREHNNILRQMNVDEFARYDGYRLSIKNLPWTENDRITMTIYAIGASGTLDKMKDKAVSAKGRTLDIANAITSPEIHIVTLKRER